ncbi:MAG TPA: trehalose-6-phosphate synthase [Bryobacteraceae bacterium]|nr:trehalose-6-phosphate synthase [Bryobacteraceae bacterium]
MQHTLQRLAVISNRLPVTLTLENGEFRSSAASGGLVSALEPLLRKHGGYWVGNPGVAGHPQISEILRQAAANRSYEYVPVYLSQDERENFYEGFSNQVIWPLFHDLQSRCNFDPIYWRHYLAVNEKFAAAAETIAGKTDLIWIQDYQLMQVAKFIRARRTAARLAFFLHTPFPGVDIYAKLPWRTQILQGLLDHDLIGLQTARDLRNFLTCVRVFLEKVQIEKDGDAAVIHHAERIIHAGAFPISIDFEAFSRDAEKPLVGAKVAELKRQSDSSRIVLGIDRLDYTKGIPERIRAFATYLRQNERAHGAISLYQIVIPSREAIPEYQRLQEEIERLVASVNGEWGQPGWTPIVYMYRPIPREELLAFYRVADIALVTPLKDGMNLVCKEYCAAKNDAEGVLILSEFAGAAAEFESMAILVNSYDEEGIANAIERALAMPDSERRNRMRKLRRQIQRFDLLHWRDRIFSAVQRLPSEEASARSATAD